MKLECIIAMIIDSSSLGGVVLNIGVIGAGAIATYLLETIHGNEKYHFQITSLFVKDKEKYHHLAEKYNVTLYTNLNEFLQAPIDVVVEAANVRAVTELLPDILLKKDVIVISIGALAEESFLHRIKEIAEENNHHIYLPSGAIGGLDLVQNVTSVGTIKDVRLETRKPAHTLTNDVTKDEQVVFNGTAADAIKKYPKNMNVSIALALAGVGFKNTKVKIIADPMIQTNTHLIEMKGAFGHASFQITNEPLPTNPNTSYLAAVSIIGTLQRMTSKVKIGI